MSSIAFPNLRKRDLTDEQNARLRAIVVNELCTLVPKQLHLSKLLGISQGNLSNFLDGIKGGSAALAIRVAFVLGRSVDDVLGVPQVHELIDPQQTRYPTRIIAARAAYLDGVDMRRIRAALNSSLGGKGDPGADAWRKIIAAGFLAEPGTEEDTQWAIDLVRGDKNAGRNARGARPSAKKRKKTRQRERV